MGRPKISGYDLAIIGEHLAPLIETADKRKATLRALPLRLRYPGYDRELQYWIDCHSALSWALGLARQRTKGGSNVGRQ